MQHKVIGDVTPQESHESGAVTVEQSTTKTLVYRGLYVSLEGMMPARGDDWQNSGMFVQRAVLEPEAGGMGKLTVTLSDRADGGDGAWSPGASPIIEIEWSRMEKPLQANPKITGGLSGADLQKLYAVVEAWSNSPQQRKRLYQAPLESLTREADPNNSSDWGSLANQALTIAQKLAKGVEGYLVFSPVITRTTVTSARPVTGGCGTIQAPPSAISGYKYLKVADTARQQADGTWQRVEQWQGADDWDTDLYAGG